MRKVLFFIMIVFLFTNSFYLSACFDTYLFLNRSSMVYPASKIVIDGLAEYSANNIAQPFNDTFLMNFNLYYGFTTKFSIQAGVSSSEKLRNEIKIDEYGIKGVYNIFRSISRKYSADIILAHHSGFGGENMTLEFSVPNMLYIKDNLIVIHPTVTFGLNKDQQEYGAHFGFFHLFKNSALVGIGYEYASPQNGSFWNKRLVDGESAMSLFFGGKIGDIFYIQNEFAKGLSNSRDFGFAATLKILL